MRECVNIVGAGLAGLSCARALAEAGVACRLVSAQMSERAQSVLAEGGINAALDLMGEQDTAEEHFADTMGGGVMLADPNAVWGLVCDAPGIVRDLVRWGVPFQRERGSMIQRNFGGQKKKRTAYVQSSTGKALVTALADEVRRFEAAGVVERLGHHELLDLAVDGDICRGAWVRDAYGEDSLFLPGPVVLCAGGLGGLFGEHTTGTTTNTGDAAAIALLRGVELANLEFVQYHPTTVAIAGKRMLISEAARGEGGRLFALRGGRPWYFMEERYPELGNLMPRDVVSREEWSVMHDPSCDGRIYLDLTGLSAAVWRDRLPDLCDEVRHYLGLDPRKHPIPVEPGIHYCMGGILVDERHRTNVRGLLAAGECACAYHGANRLGGNSLLGAVRGGRVAAQTLIDAGEGLEAERDHGADARSEDGVPTPMPPVSPRQAELLYRCMGIVRSEEGLREGLEVLERLPENPHTVLACACVSAALARKESRGAHWRRDYPDTDPDLRRTTVVRRGTDGLHIEMRPIPVPREGVPAL